VSKLDIEVRCLASLSANFLQDYDYLWESLCFTAARRRVWAAFWIVVDQPCRYFPPSA
jgi:hypothetical protein